MQDEINIEGSTDRINRAIGKIRDLRQELQDEAHELKELSTHLYGAEQEQEKGEGRVKENTEGVINHLLTEIADLESAVEWLRTERSRLATAVHS